jgi:hypothetical protein
MLSGTGNMLSYISLLENFTLFSSKNGNYKNSKLPPFGNNSWKSTYNLQENRSEKTEQSPEKIIQQWNKFYRSI